MAARLIHDLYDGKTLYMIAGSTEFLRLALKRATTGEPVDLREITEIEWMFAPYSVLENKAVVRKSLSGGGIVLLLDSDGDPTGTIQATIEGKDTQGLQGAFVHQISVTDADGARFTPFEGLIVINRGIVAW